MVINWNGVFPAVTTKFTENDEQSSRAYIDDSHNVSRVDSIAG